MENSNHHVPPLTDEVRHEEPAAWMVFSHDGATADYKIFDYEGEAQDYALDQAEMSGVEVWTVYPLYAHEGEDVTL